MEYLVDATQRGIRFWDVMRQRGNQYREHLAETIPHVLDYAAELVGGGRTLERPVNYALARIVPPQGVEIDEDRRPFVVVDPRAGREPGFPLWILLVSVHILLDNLRPRASAGVSGSSVRDDVDQRP